MAKIALDERIGSGMIHSRRTEIYGEILTNSSDRKQRARESKDSPPRTAAILGG